MAMATSGKAGKTAKANTVKTESRESDQPVKLTLYLSSKLAKQFATHAVQMGQGKSDLFAEMVQAHCRRFIVHDHAKEEGRARAAGQTGAGGADENAP